MLEGLLLEGISTDVQKFEFLDGAFPGQFLSAVFFRCKSPFVYSCSVVFTTCAANIVVAGQIQADLSLCIIIVLRSLSLCRVEALSFLPGQSHVQSP